MHIKTIVRCYCPSPVMARIKKKKKKSEIITSVGDWWRNWSPHEPLVGM